MLRSPHDDRRPHDLSSESHHSPESNLIHEPAQVALINLPMTSWLDGLELETSTTIWSFKSPLLETSSDDWSEVSRRASYQIKPSLFYRGQLRLYSRLIDLSITYASREGVSFLGSEGSLLDLVISTSSLVPALAPLSMHLQRARFTQGQVTLNQDQIGAIEHQIFSMEVNRYEARWQLDAGGAIGSAVTYAYDLRALPRQIYLEERIQISDQESAYAYYDISDQLLWTKSELYEIGSVIDLPIGEQLQFTLGAGLGFGSYDLLTPIEGVLLDEGSLLSFSFKAGAKYSLPLSSWLSLCTSYELSGLGLGAVGLPSKLKRELSADGVDLDGLSLSFGTVDFLHRVWFSLVFHLASKPA